MVSKTVLCAFALSLVIGCYSKPHHDQGFMSRGVQQHRHDMDELMVYQFQQQQKRNQEEREEQGKRWENNQEEREFKQGRQQRKQYKNEENSWESQEQKKQSQSEEREYGWNQQQKKQKNQQHEQQWGRSVEDKEIQSGEQSWDQQKKQKNQQWGIKNWEDKEVKLYDGKMQPCSVEEERDQPCVVDGDRKNKQVRVQDTSSGESQERKVKVLASHEDQESAEVKQGRRTVMVHHNNQKYQNQQRVNVQTSRRGNDWDNQSEEENSQEFRNKVSKY